MVKPLKGRGVHRINDLQRHAQRLRRVDNGPRAPTQADGGVAFAIFADVDQLIISGAEIR